MKSVHTLPVPSAPADNRAHSFRSLQAGRALSGIALAFLSACSGACNGSPESGPGPTPEPGTSQGLALAIGLNRVDPAHYGGWSGPLSGCEPDARDMHAIATGANLSSRTLLTTAATREAVLAGIADAAARLASGGLFVLSYSGHGGQVPDANGDDPDDGMDETWCLFDGELLDDELYGALGAFAAGVRVLVFSDSCHSGTVLKMRRGDFEEPETERRELLERSWSTQSKPKVLAVRDRPTLDQATLAPRSLPPGVAIETFRRNRPFYEQIGTRAPRDARAAVKCQALLISGCEDDQLSADLGTNGLFTLELVHTWNNGAFQGGHPDFQQAIRAAVLQSNPSQAPAHFSVGIPIPGFEAQKPYTLGAP